VLQPNEEHLPSLFSYLRWGFVPSEEVSDPVDMNIHADAIRPERNTSQNQESISTAEERTGSKPSLG